MGTPAHRNISSRKDSYSKAVSLWLGSGAITAGIGAALAFGTGIANADSDTDESPSVGRTHTVAAATKSGRVNSGVMLTASTAKIEEADQGVRARSRSARTPREFSATATVKDAYRSQSPILDVGGKTAAASVADALVPTAELPALPDLGQLPHYEDLGAAPETVSELASRVPRTADTMKIEFITDDDDRVLTAMIVYMSGINDPFLSLTNAGIGYLSGGGPQYDWASSYIDSYLATAVAKYWTYWGNEPDAKGAVSIMLVGYSNGGMIAQNYAAKGLNKDLVKSVLTLGSPLFRKTYELPADTRVLNIQSSNDYVPQWFNDTSVLADYAQTPRSLRARILITLGNTNIFGWQPFAAQGREGRQLLAYVDQQRARKSIVTFTGDRSLTDFPSDARHNLQGVYQSYANRFTVAATRTDSEGLRAKELQNRILWTKEGDSSRFDGRVLTSVEFHF